MGPKFTVKADCSPDATSLTLQYRYVLPDFDQFGNPTYTAWTNYVPYTNVSVVNITSYTFVFVTAGIEYNTVYQFRVEQVCNSGIVYSPIDGDYYETNCPTTPAFTAVLGPFLNGAYTIDVNIYTAGLSSGIDYQKYSIISYQVIVQYPDPIDPTQIVYDAVSINAAYLMVGLPSYYVQLSDSNLTYPIQIGTTYTISLDYTIVSTENAPYDLVTIQGCSTKIVNIPSCNTYTILTGDRWYITWTDCDGTAKSCFSPVPLSGNLCDPNTYLRICSITTPQCYYLASPTPPSITCVPLATQTNTLNCGTQGLITIPERGAIIKNMERGCNSPTDLSLICINCSS